MGETDSVSRDPRRVPSPADERSVAEGVRAGDEEALGRLLGMHWQGLVRFVYPIVGSVDEAEDVVQAAFVRTWARREEWRRTDSLRPVLYRIARNLALNERRRRRAFRLWSIRHPPTAADPRTDPGRDAEAADLRLALKRALAALPPRRREIFVLVRFHGMSFREAASVLSLSAQTIANQMSQATRDLQEALEPFLEAEGATEFLVFPGARQREPRARQAPPR